MGFEYNQDRPKMEVREVGGPFDCGDCITQRDRVKGTEVWRWPRTHERSGHDYRDFYLAGDEPGIWFTRERALQLLDAEYRLCLWITKVCTRCSDAVEST